MTTPEQRAVSVALTCTSCHHQDSYLVHTPLFATKPMFEREGVPWPEGWDGFFTPTVVRCTACGALDTYTLSMSAMLRAMLPGSPIQRGLVKLHDGMIPKRASDAIAHLRQICDSSASGEPWLRLGNFYHAGGSTSEALSCWRSALRIDNKPEAPYNLAVVASEAGDKATAASYAEEALRRYPDPTRQRPGRLSEEQLVDLVSVLREDRSPGRSILAIWVLEDNAKQPLIAASSARLDRITDWRSLVQFLVDERPLNINFADDDLPRDSPPSQLELWIDDPDTYNELPPPSVGPAGSSAEDRRKKKQKRKAAKDAKRKNRR